MAFDILVHLILIFNLIFIRFLTIMSYYNQNAKDRGTEINKEREVGEKVGKRRGREKQRREREKKH